jgi:hypothetical protein
LQTLNLERVHESKNAMNVRGFGLHSCFVLLALLGSVTIEARCIDVVDAQLELPYHIVTAKNTGISYRYNLEQEQYEVSWSINGVEGGPYGPFTLTRSCAPAKVAWESDNFLLLSAGCGTFCWYVLALPMISSIEDHIKIERPLAFDESRDLIAHYCDKDLVCVESLLTGQQQRIRTEHECDSASGLCIEQVRITATSLEYKWRYTPDGQALVAPLDARLQGN